MTANAGDLIATIVQEVFWLLLIIAMPIMLILVLIEFGVNIICLAGQIKMPSVEFLMKTLVFVLAMPLLVYGFARTINGAFDSAPPPLTLLEQFSGP